MKRKIICAKKLALGLKCGRRDGHAGKCSVSVGTELPEETDTAMSV